MHVHISIIICLRENNFSAYFFFAEIYINDNILFIFFTNASIKFSLDCFIKLEFVYRRYSEILLNTILNILINPITNTIYQKNYNSHKCNAYIYTLYVGYSSGHGITDH